MSSTSAPFGLRPAVHPSGTIRQTTQDNGIASAYGTALYSGTPIVRGTDGTIQAATTSSRAAIGVFLGCEYTAADGRFVVSPYWPASATYTDDGKMQAYYTDDPEILYDGQCNGSVAATAIGEGINLADNSQGSTYTGQSTQSLNATTTGATAGLGTVVGIPTGSYYGGQVNAPGDTYTIVRIRLTYQGPVA